jgi:preprotein translocase subunit SecG
MRALIWIVAVVALALVAFVLFTSIKSWGG